MPAFAETDSSSSEAESVKAITNGVHKTTLNGSQDSKDETKSGDDSSDTSKVADKPALDPALVGMECGSKNLYSGKEDKKGRYQWQDTIPEDLGKPVEDAETAKWALLVRNVKVYNDPRKVLAIHSIVVQSPLLKKLLEKVLKDYPGVTPGLQRLEFNGKFEPLIHRWPQLEAAVEALKGGTEEEVQTREHAQLLKDILWEEFKDAFESIRDMTNKGVITFPHLWTLFQPGAIVFAKQDGQETALKLSDTSYGRDRAGNPVFWVSGKHVEFDGTKFGTNKVNISINSYAGTKKITQLASYPLSYHKDVGEMEARLVERGRKVEELAGTHYKYYHGMAWKRGQFGGKDKYNIKGRIVIDTYGWNRFNPNNAVYATALQTKEAVVANGIGTGDEPVEGGEENEDEDEEEDYDDEDDSGMPNDGAFADEDESRRPPLTTEQKMICSPTIRAYALKQKLWLNFFVNSVKEITWSDGAFDSLVLPDNQKELILGFTESQQKNKEIFDDVIESKGKGCIILLCGPPGVGKTLTAESCSEQMRAPLYMMSAGDLGLDPRNVETKLQNVLEMCTRWNALLLLDEADVFLEQRSLHELERNKLVSIFLRTLEYYEGIMFLTTNRVETFDAAFQSRIHISLNYPDLSADSRRTIWKNFLGQLLMKHTITDPQVHQLSLMKMNGRQIKNILKTAQLLASRREEALTFKHIKNVLDVTQHLHNATQENEMTRSSLFN